jgi:hypothetical protein
MSILVKPASRDYLRTASKAIKTVSGEFISPGAVMRALLAAATEVNIDLAGMGSEESIRNCFKARLTASKVASAITQAVQ